MTTTTNQEHNYGHPCQGVPKESMIACNYNGRIRSVREMATVAQLVKVTSTGVFLNGNNAGLATKQGEPILLGVSEQRTNPLINDGLDVDATKINDAPPEKVNTTALGAMVSRNAFTHVGGPLVVDASGHINYNLLLRGYNMNGVLASRDTDKYLGLDLKNDGTDGLLILSSGSITTTTDPGTPQETKTVNYEAGETMRIRVSGTGTSLANRTLTFERRDTDSVVNGSAAVWTTVMVLSA